MSTLCHHTGHRAVIVRRDAKAPGDQAVSLRKKTFCIALIPVTRTPSARARTATVVVRHDIRLPIIGVFACAHPGDRGRLGIRRARPCRTSAALAHQCVGSNNRPSSPQDSSLLYSPGPCLASPATACPLRATGNRGSATVPPSTAPKRPRSARRLVRSARATLRAKNQGSNRLLTCPNLT